MKRIVTIATAFALCFGTQSCQASEGNGEEQKSDIASKITEEIENEDLPDQKSKEKKEEAFEFNTNQKKDYLITISTVHGDMELILFDETIEHKKNFVKLASEGFYDSTAFHRVINEFMIQGGDPNSKTDNTRRYGQGGPGYTIPAEFNAKYIHKKGALAAARTGGPSNPNRESSGSQFYIVEGKTQSKEQLIQLQKSKYEREKFAQVKRILNLPENKEDLAKVMTLQQERNKKGVDAIVTKYSPEAEKIAKEKFPAYTEEQLKTYEEIGGTAMLDMDYTVYGQVVKGLDVIDIITEQPLGGSQGSLPNQKITMTVKVELLKKKKITKRTGYEFD